jgi:hypothetical protein
MHVKESGLALFCMKCLWFLSSKNTSLIKIFDFVMALCILERKHILVFEKENSI